MQNIMRKYIDIVTEGTDPRDIQISLMSLAKTNNGRFKSDKQRDFLRSIITRYDGSPNYFQGPIERFHGHEYSFDFELDDEGVVKITKRTSKGLKVTFQRGDDKDFNDKIQARYQAFKSLVEPDIRSYEARIKELEDEIQAISQQFKEELAALEQLKKTMPNRIELWQKMIDELPSKRENQIKKLQKQIEYEQSDMESRQQELDNFVRKYRINV